MQRQRPKRPPAGQAALAEAVSVANSPRAKTMVLKASEECSEPAKKAAPAQPANEASLA